MFLHVTDAADLGVPSLMAGLVKSCGLIYAPGSSVTCGTYSYNSRSTALYPHALLTKRMILVAFYYSYTFTYDKNGRGPGSEYFVLIYPMIQALMGVRPPLTLAWSALMLVVVEILISALYFLSK